MKSIQDLHNRITELEHAVAKERRRRLTVENLPAGAVYTDGTNIELNPAAERIIGYRTAEIPSLDAWFRTLYPDNHRDIVQIYDEARSAGFPEPKTFALRRKGGEIRWVEFAASATPDGEVWMLTDVTERRRTEEILGERSAEISMYLESASQGIVTVSEGGIIQMVNARTEEMFGFRREELLGKELEILLPERYRGRHHLHRASYFHEPRVRPMGVGLELAGRRKDGSEFPIEIGLSFVRTKQGVVAMGLVTDMTMFKRARQKETQLKEIHHRVKNNLQVVSSLLGLQSRSSQDGEVRKMFQESQNRVQSMALLHERLYESENLNEIDCREYVTQLAAYLFRSYGVSSSRVKLEISLDDLWLNMDQAVPSGLIINELVSNSLKHAFPQGNRGEIRIEMRKTPAETILLRVCDTGAGLPKDVNLWKARSLGLRLVRTLASQLNARVSIRNEPGTEVEIEFSAGPADPPGE
ncbi:MAG: sensor histidine kinase [Bryobacteraceae bacterium]